MKLILAYTLTLATIVTAGQSGYSLTQDHAAPARRTIQRTLQDDAATRPPLATRPPIPVPGVTRPPIDSSTPPDGATDIPTFSPTVMPSPTPTVGKVATAFPTKATVEETGAPTVGSSPTSMPSFRPTALTDPNYGWFDDDEGGAYCVLIQTLTDPDASGALTPDGYITVEIDSGSGYIVETTPYDEEGGQEYAQGEVVLDKCYNDILGVTVSGPDGNGWRGSIVYSTDDKVTYTPFVCVENCSGDEDETDPIAVDNNGNGGSESGPNCLNGDVCTLKMTRDDDTPPSDDDGDDSETGTEEECQSIVDIAAGNPDFSTLVAAVTAAGLVDALSGDGPLTVFAPTNDAFAALPEGTVESLLQAENIDTLTDILTYHVVAAKVLSTDLVNGEDVETLNGDSITVTVDDDGSVKINDSNVITADIEACEGVIHVIDAVLLPPADDDDASVAVETSSPTVGAAETSSPTVGATSGSPTSEPTSGSTSLAGGINATLAPTSSSTGTSDDGTTDSPTPALVPATETSSPTSADDEEEVSPPTVVSMIPITSSPTNTVSMLNPPSASLPDGMTDSPTKFVNVTNPIFGLGSKSYKSKGSKASSTLEEEDASRPSGKSGKGSKSVEGKASKSTKGSKAGYLNSLLRAEDISAAPADRSCRWGSIVALGALYLWFA